MCTERIRGAIYIPARAFNAPQMWRERLHWTTETNPSGLNPQFIRLFCGEPEPGIAPVNYGTFADYLSWQEKGK